jgi:hypothetical protein
MNLHDLLAHTAPCPQCQRTLVFFEFVAPFTDDNILPALRPHHCNGSHQTDHDEIIQAARELMVNARQGLTAAIQLEEEAPPPTRHRGRPRKHKSKASKPLVFGKYQTSTKKTHKPRQRYKNTDRISTEEALDKLSKKDIDFRHYIRDARMNGTLAYEQEKNKMTYLWGDIKALYKAWRASRA